jgi:hypothetical protein
MRRPAAEATAPATAPLLVVDIDNEEARAMIMMDDGGVVFMVRFRGRVGF